MRIMGWTWNANDYAGTCGGEMQITINASERDARSLLDAVVQLLARLEPHDTAPEPGNASAVPTAVNDKPTAVSFVEANAPMQPTPAAIANNNSAGLNPAAVHDAYEKLEREAIQRESNDADILATVPQTILDSPKLSDLLAYFIAAEVTDVVELSRICVELKPRAASVRAVKDIPTRVATTLLAMGY